MLSHLVWIGTRIDYCRFTLSNIRLGSTVSYHNDWPAGFAWFQASICRPHAMFHFCFRAAVSQHERSLSGRDLTLIVPDFWTLFVLSKRAGSYSCGLLWRFQLFSLNVVIHVWKGTPFKRRHKNTTRSGKLLYMYCERLLAHQRE